MVMDRSPARLPLFPPIVDANVLRAQLPLHGLRSGALELDFHLVGIVGFSGSWRRNSRRDARSVTRRVLENLFRGLGEARARTWCVSGATDYGVPAVAYEVAGRLGMPRIGLAAREALDHKLAPLDMLSLVGNRFGDESRAFVELCDQFWMIGGGSQSEQEMRLAARQGKPIIVVRGLGGRAESLTAADLPGAEFVDADEVSGLPYRDAGSQS